MASIIVQESDRRYTKAFGNIKSQSAGLWRNCDGGMKKLCGPDGFHHKAHEEHEDRKNTRLRGDGLALVVIVSYRLIQVSPDAPDSRQNQARLAIPSWRAYALCAVAVQSSTQ